ncbi:MAG: DNA-3-methyladenine glycosylase family protein [Gammaproteobacteria bacterium]|nr:DNA-3-methyladenine glycosylase 2 family protein [SAR86 cluster bacterium]
MNKTLYSEGIKHLLKVEPCFEKIISKEEIDFFRRPEGFAGILYLVIEQQVSVQAANSIKNKVKTLMHDVSADRFLELSIKHLRGAGLSGPKISYLQGIAKEEKNGNLNYGEIVDMTDEEARSYLCKFKGIGKWTADCYLMASLDRPDIWPENDIGLQEGVRRLKDLKTRPTVEDMTSIARKWRPFRSVAANIIWADYD